MKRNIAVKRSRYLIWKPVLATCFVLLLLLPIAHVCGQADRVEAVSITVSNLQRAVDFYTKVLTFKEIARTETMHESVDALFGQFGTRVKTATLQLGNERIQLIEFVTPSEGRSIPEDSRSYDLWFQHLAIVVSDMEKAHGLLQAAGVKYVSTAPQTLPSWNANAAGIKAFYFKDPDNHVLELIYFPAGKGQDVWHTPTQKIFLGIDHTAIGVSSSEKSLQFYNEVCGLNLKGQGVNYGLEQAHLNHVQDAHVRISGLRAAAGFGVEFLEYLQPRGKGRQYPVNSQVCDLWHEHTQIHVQNLKNIVAAAEKLGMVRISTSETVRVTAELKSILGNYQFATLFRDPDGHAVLLVE